VFDWIITMFARFLFVVMEVSFAYFAIDICLGYTLNWTLILVMAWVIDTAKAESIREGLTKERIISGRSLRTYRR
jgi:hypothetical protein